MESSGESKSLAEDVEKWGSFAEKACAFLENFSCLWRKSTAFARVWSEAEEHATRGCRKYTPIARRLWWGKNNVAVDTHCCATTRFFIGGGEDGFPKLRLSTRGVELLNRLSMSELPPVCRFSRVVWIRKKAAPRVKHAFRLDWE